MGGVPNYTVEAGVTPAALNRDFGKGRVMQQYMIPDVRARDAAEPARQHARHITQEGRRYRLNSNSNSYAADVAEGLSGVRPGDVRTPGAEQPLSLARPARGLAGRSELRPMIGKRF